MSDLSSAIEAETAAYEPDRVPSFETVLARKRARDQSVRGAAGALLAAALVGGAVLVPSLVDGRQETLAPPATSPSAAAGGESDGLAPPGDADTLVLCRRRFEGPVIGTADCAVTSSADRLASVRNVLAPAEPRPAPERVCLIGAGGWDLIWLGGERVIDRIAVPDATCLYATRGPQDEQVFAISDRMLDTFETVHAAEAGQGGAFDGLADPAPPAALCARQYPQDLPAQPLAFDAVVLGISNTEPADAPESPGVPFSDLDVLVLDRYAGQPAQRLTVRALVGRPDPDRAVGERLLIATDDPPSLGPCGFTQPYSQETAQQWIDAFR